MRTRASERAMAGKPLDLVRSGSIVWAGLLVAAGAGHELADGFLGALVVVEDGGHLLRIGHGGVQLTDAGLRGRRGVLTGRAPPKGRSKR